MKLPKIYEPNLYENDIYALWEKSEAFAPKYRGSKNYYSQVMPPPNANANLHIGYTLVVALEDIAARYHRMKGDATLLLPGADHAGFETQSVYEKHLAKTGKSRFDFNRDELYQQIWDFVALNRGNFDNQLRAMGASCDWSRYTFTLDEKIIKRAYSTFKKMWDEKLIYRGERLVNFCTFHGTGFADIEVEYKEEQSKLWHIKYPLTDGSGEVVIATTRPETMLGDTAVAIHPKDGRYKQLVGKTIKLPLTQREIPIIADNFVDMKFGTGAVKITPAHDPNDFDMAQRHDLPMISVIDHEGKLTHDVPMPYRSLDAEQARKIIVNDLKDLELLDKEEDYTHNVGHCYKCGTVIQPLLREQWFVDMQPLAKTAIAVLRANKIIFHPTTKKTQLINYLKGLKDWNISRQIAWGIPIPAFQNIEDPDDWIFDERVEEVSIEVNGKIYRRDSDVFDTWFSSSSWPYASLGYPKEPDFKEFYPLSLMETGGEILYPWVSRMIMLGLYITGEVPFKEVYIHGYVMAENGAKMSKSTGNVVDPLPVIKQYGSDALRMGIVAGRSPGVNRGYDQRKVEDARNFANKLWNVARFIEDKVGDNFKAKTNPKPKTSADYWILYKLQHLTDQVGAYIEQYRFSEAYDLVYHTLWDDFADWYIEASKSQPNNEILAYGLDIILRVTHPFAPFVTETIWQTLNGEGDSLLITSPWPKVTDIDTQKAKEFEQIKALVSEIRYIKGTVHLRDNLRLYHKGEVFLNQHGTLIKKLAQIEDIQEVRDGYGLHLTSVPFACWLDIDQETAHSFLEQLKSRLVDQKKLVERLETRLANKAYTKNAPKELIEETRTQLEEAKELGSKLYNEYERFSGST
ncbi:valine--tRNA ligase [Candidatus Saccharibacteria bacterium]|nr:valine--tRNA ligase [Candidatus Saccharibacteria bacterium]MBI3337956.1 valine--tRNA ligase [Candidatus Saccharibacteria bacterium]